MDRDTTRSSAPECAHERAPERARVAAAGARLWRAALACFVLAAATGAALRFAALHGLPFGLAYGDVRHAHSHLMFFSWVTPALLAFAPLPRPEGRRVRLGLAAAALATGLLAYVPFLLSGYGLLAVGGRELPLSMMAAGLAGVAWILFALHHLRTSAGRPRTPPLRALDGAVALLLLASAGAGGLAVAGMAAPDGSPWLPALVTLFLESFGDGWFALALLALALEDRPEAQGPAAARGTVLLAAALVARGLARLAGDVGASWATAPETVAALAAGAALLLVALPLLRAERWRGWSAWTLPLLLVAGKGAFELALAFAPARAWADAAGLRVVLLHAWLLGAVTLGLVAAARERLGARAAGAPVALAVAVAAMLAALLPLTSLLPAGAWALRAAAWTSLGPPLVVAVSLARSRSALR